MKLNTAFGLGGLLIVLHKVESYLQAEYDIDPAYWHISRLLSQNEGVFIALIASLSLIFISIFLVGSKGSGQRIIYALGGILFSHEIHHLIRSLLKMEYYPGTISGLVCFFFSLYYWRLWFKSR